jgi:hypothetical protein
VVRLCATVTQKPLLTTRAAWPGTPRRPGGTSLPTVDRRQWAARQTWRWLGRLAAQLQPVLDQCLGSRHRRRLLFREFFALRVAALPLPPEAKRTVGHALAGCG